MTLRPEYSLGHSEYNAFLFASVGEEKTGLQLTVQTALIRLGFDPWQEAARLAGLPKGAAVQALTAAMARLPEGDWKASGLPEIAARLVASLPGSSLAGGSLPGRSAPVVPSTEAKRPAAPRLSFHVPRAVVWALLAGALFAGVLALQGSNDFEAALGDGSPAQYNN